MLTTEEAAGHVARRRKDLDAALTKEEQVRRACTVMFACVGVGMAGIVPDSLPGKRFYLSSRACFSARFLVSARDSAA